MSTEGAKPVKVLIWNTTTKTWEKWDGVLTTGDIQIGAVELKDHDGDDRLEITAANAAKVDGSGVTQPVEEQSPLDISGLATSAKQLADNHQVTVSNPTADPETGLAKEATLGDVLTELEQKTEPADNQSTIPQGLVERIVFNTLKRLNVDSAGRLRVSAESAVIASGTITTVTTVGTITSLTNWGLSTAIAKSQWESNLQYQQGFRRNLAVV